MRIYTRIVMDMTQDDLPVVEAESHDYQGALALCWGLGSEGSGRGNRGVTGHEGVGSSRGADRGSSRGDSGTTGSASRGGDRGGRDDGFDPADNRSMRDALGSASFGLSDGRGYQGFDNRDERGLLQDVSRQDRRDIRDATSAARLDNPMGWRDHARNIGYGLGVMGRMGQAAMAGPLGLGVMGAREIGRMQDVASLRSPETRSSPSFGQMAGYDPGADQTQDRYSPQELLRRQPEAEALGTAAAPAPRDMTVPDGEMTTEDMANLEMGNPLRNALRISFRQQLGDIKQQHILKALREMRGAGGA